MQNREQIQVDLALQGGGAHGAFTWGVLDRLLEEDWLKIEGISGTSAGAMNAAALISGYVEGGPTAAREKLALFWRRVSDAGRLSPLQRNPVDVMLGRWTLDTSPFFFAADMMSRIVSPYDLNPRGTNPLRQILEEVIDFGKIAQAPIAIFVTAMAMRESCAIDCLFRCRAQIGQRIVGRILATAGAALRRRQSLCFKGISSRRMDAWRRFAARRPRKLSVRH